MKKAAGPYIFSDSVYTQRRWKFKTWHFFFKNFNSENAIGKKVTIVAYGNIYFGVPYTQINIFS